MTWGKDLYLACLATSNKCLDQQYVRVANGLSLTCGNFMIAKQGLPNYFVARHSALKNYS